MWLPAKNYLKDQHDISVHFSNSHYHYYSAWKYVTKQDKQVLQSENHPDLWKSKPLKTHPLCALFAVQPGQSPLLRFRHIFLCGDLAPSKGLALYQKLTPSRLKHISSFHKSSE